MNRIKEKTLLTFGGGMFVCMHEYRHAHAYIYIHMYIEKIEIDR